MKTVSISYNPYTVKTDVLIDGKPIDEAVSPLRYVLNKRLQEWIEPKGGWPGVYDSLRKFSGEDQIRIEFTGTFGDFEDMKYAKDRFGGSFSKIELVHVNKETAGEADPYKKMSKLKDLYQKLQDGPVDEFKTDDIKRNFNEAINSDFKIVIVAPMSSGKSTLINAIVGRDLLPAVNQATTAVITEIKDNDDFENFIVNATDKHGNIVAKDEIATKKLISDLNYKKDPDDPEGKEALIHLVNIEGPIPNLPSKDLSTVFVDTPGGNNSQNEEHEEMMDEAINDENKSLILYVFNGTQLGTNDSNIILKKIANAMQNSINGKQSRDRFLFVANRMDDNDIEKEPYEEVIENTILKQLASNGITEPNLFLTSAQTAKLIRMEVNGEELSEKEEEDYETLIKRFNRTSRMLTQYSSLNLSDKEKLTEEAEKNMNQAKETDSMKEAEQFKRRAAEINSGVPSLELAIRNYLEKYAIAIKIKTVHDTFMKKVVERNMIDNCEAEWAESKESYESILKEIEKKESEFDHSKKLQEFKDAVKDIKFDRKKVDNLRAEINIKMDALMEERGDKVEIPEAKLIIDKFTDDLKTIGDEADTLITNELKNAVLDNCIRIVEEYSEYIRKLDSDGAFSVGNFDIKKTKEFGVFDIGKVDDLLDDNTYKGTKKVQNGTKKEAKSGITNVIKRLFGVKSGWKDVPIYKDVNVFKVKQFIEDHVMEVKQLFDDELQKRITETNGIVENLKKNTVNKLKDLDEMISNLYKELKKKMESREALEKRVKENEEKAKWVKEFIDEVEDLLTV